MFLYPVSLFGRSIRISNVNQFRTRSAAISLAKACKLAGNSEAMLQRIDKLKPSLNEPIHADVAALLIAVNSDDADSVKTRYDNLMSSAEKILPPIESVTAEFVEASPNSISSEMMQDSLATFDMADSLSQALLPMAEIEAYQVDADHGLLRMIGMIVSDGYAHSRVETQVGFLTKDLVARFGQRNEDELLKNTIGTRLASMEVQYSGYSGDYGEQMIRKESRLLSMQLARMGKWTLSAQTARKLPVASLRDTTETRHAANLCVVLGYKRNAKRRYENVALFSFGLGEDKTFRHFDSDLRYQVPPAELAEVAPRAKALEKLPRWADDVSLTSTALILLEAAIESDRTDELLAELTKRVENPGDDVDALIGTLHLLNDNREAAKEKLVHVSKRILGIDENKVNNKSTVSTIAFGFAAKCIDAELEPALAVKTLEKLLNHSRKASINNLTTIIGGKLAQSGGSVAAGAGREIPFKHFVQIAAPASYGHPDPIGLMPLTSYADGKVHQAGGFGFHSVMLRYPLEGNFSFSGGLQDLGYGESTITGNGLTFSVEAWQKKLVARELASWSGPQHDCAKAKHGGLNQQTIKYGDEKIEFQLEGESLLETKRTTSFPFVGIQATQYRITEFGGLKISGDATIPREVNLIDPQLRGWRSLMYGARMPDPVLPVEQGKDAAEVAKQRETARTKEANLCTWHVVDGELRSGKRFSTRGAQQGLADLQYLRPLLEGESVTMEFFHDGKKQTLHPSIGRVIVYLRDDGPKLAWTKLPESIEADNAKLLKEVDPADLRLTDGKIPFKKEDWNELKLTAESGKIVVALNGQSLCSVPTHPNDRFGFVREKDHQVKIRKLVLTGPWPEKLPDDLMATK